MYGALAFSDLGHRAPSAPVSVSLTLRYNNQAELDRFVADVSNPHSGSYRRFLTPQEFAEKYAPTVPQERTVVETLQREGFTITQRFPNRTIVDATAPSSTVERFFATEIHTVQQGKYGERFTNLKPASVPASIASLVRTASLSNLVAVRTVAEQTAAPIKTKTIVVHDKVAGHSAAGKEVAAVRPRSREARCLVLRPVVVEPRLRIRQRRLGDHAGRDHRR